MADTELLPDAWLYESDHMVYKRTDRDLSLLGKGFTETPLFYTRPNQGHDALVEASARAMCKFDGLDPDETVSTGLIKPAERKRWEMREFAGRAKAAIEALTNLPSPQAENSYVPTDHGSADERGSVAVPIVAQASEAPESDAGSTPAGDATPQAEAAPDDGLVERHIEALLKLKREVPSYMGDAPKARHYQWLHSGIDAAITALRARPSGDGEGE